MPTYTVQMAFERTSGLPKDRVVNTFHTMPISAPPASTELAGFMAGVEEFYIGTSPAGTFVCEFLANSLTGAYTVSAYEDGVAGPAVLSFTGDVPGIGTSRLPNEVAVCLSFKADPALGGPAARHRGRIFLGPLALEAMQPSPAYSADARVSNELQGALLDGATRVKAAGLWAVHSRAAGANYPVHTAWVDNAFDTQRRRGTTATARQILVLV